MTNRRRLASILLLPAASALASVVAGAADGWKTPRTPWGDPDLQGTWTSEAELSVPFERPVEFGTRELLTDEELAEREARTAAQVRRDSAEFDLATADISNAGQVGSATSPPPHWLERSKTSRRTSIVIDPPDGRIPPLTPEARRRIAAAPLGTFGRRLFDGPEDLSLWERCITRGMPAAIFPTVYNANTRIVQGPGLVAVTYEMIHDTRLIPTDGRPHVGAAIRQYDGDSRGRWEGDTLVVEVTNFAGAASYRGSGDGLHLVERFSRVGPDRLRYEVTAHDPRTWTRPWTAAVDLERQALGMFEYACHEGNYAMDNILRASRAAGGRVK